MAFFSTSGVAVFKHYWEHDIDAAMKRTAKKPLPAGLVSPRGALLYSLILSALGVALGFILLVPLPGLFVFLEWFFYAVLYTIF